MLARGQDSHGNFAGRHGRIYFFLPFDLFLLDLFPSLALLRLVQPVGGGGREQDQENSYGAEKSDQHQAQITDVHAENGALIFGSLIMGRRRLHGRVLARHSGKTKAPPREGRAKHQWLTSRKA